MSCDKLVLLFLKKVVIYLLPNQSDNKEIFIQACERFYIYFVDCYAPNAAGLWPELVLDGIY